MNEPATEAGGADAPAKATPVASSRRRGHRRRGRGLPAATLLITAALVPLAGAGWFTSRELSLASTSRARASEVAAAVDHLVELTELRSRLVDERNWTLALVGAREYGVSPDIIATFSSLDLVAEATTARAGVDELLATSPRFELLRELEPLRADDATTEQVYDGYIMIEDELAAESESDVAALLALVADVQDASPLANDVRILSHAADARQAAASELSTYFRARARGRNDPVEDVQLLAAQRAIRGRALSRLMNTVEPGSETAAAIEHLEQSADVATFEADVDRLLVETITVGLDGRDLSPSALLGDLRDLARLFTAGSQAAQAHLELVTAAASDVQDEVETAIQAADASTRRTWITIASLVAATAALGVVLSRWLVSPIQRLAQQAGRLRDGKDASELEPRGPRETREVARAMNEASVHLGLVEQQAVALAHGDLHHPVLLEEAAGSLGASLQRAVQTLASSMTERERFQEQLTHEATHDGLTGIPNRTASLDRLAADLAQLGTDDGQLAVLFVDLDGFKHVNDAHGHHAGDVVLRAVAQRMAAEITAPHHIGRLGGDEFVAIIGPIDSIDDVLDAATRLRTTICQPISIGDTTVAIDASIGIALAGAEPEVTATEVLHDADLAVYRAKALGRGNLVLCDDELRARVHDQATLDRAVRDGVLHDEFVLHYQPVFDAHVGTPNALEALVRWERPGHGLVMPADFVPFAERSDLISVVDRWVLRAVARQLRIWAGHATFGRVPVAVNVSARHLAADDFVESVLGPLREFGVDPGRVILEVTESALLDDLEGVAAKLTELRQLGVRVAIDDFGTGYTSLAYLRTLPVDIVKIDRSFTADRGAVTLIELIVSAGHSLGAQITAEGIETAEQARCVIDLGCDSVQGYHYARPCPVDELDGAVVDAPGVDGRVGSR